MKMQIKKIAAIILAAAILVSSMLTGMSVIAADGEKVSADTIILKDQKGNRDVDITGTLVEDSNSPSKKNGVGYAFTSGFFVPDSAQDDTINATLSGDSNFSIEVWVNPSDLDSGNAFFAKGNHQVSIKTTGNTLEYCIYNNGNWYVTAANFDDTTLKANKWNHIVATREDKGDTSETKLYVNGKLEVTGTKETGTINSSNDLAGVGYLEDGNADLTLRGSMASAHVYNKVLNDDEVAALNNGSGDILLTAEDSSVVLWYDAAECDIITREKTLLSEDLLTDTNVTAYGFNQLYGQNQNNYKYATYMGWNPTLSYNIVNGEVGTFTFKVPDGATALTGKITMCDGALTYQTTNKFANDNYVWFTVDDSAASVVGPFKKFTDTTNDDFGQNFGGAATTYDQLTTDGQAQLKERAFQFTVAIPAGSETITINVHSSNCSWQYATLFDTGFVTEEVDENLATADAKIAAWVDEIDQMMDGFYFLKDTADVEGVQSAYNALTNAQKASLNSTYFYNCYLDNAIFTPADGSHIDGYNNPNLYNYWIRSSTGDNWTATQDALKDEMKYEFMKRGFNVSITGANSNTNNSFHAWLTNYYYLQMGGATGGETALTSPFPGTAFTLKKEFYHSGALASKADMLPLSNTFDYDGKTYQVCWNNTGIIDEDGAVTANDLYPGSGVAATGNAFRKAFAEYNQDVKWDGKTLGIPTANAATSADETVSQAFNGPNGVAYIIANADMLAANEAVVVTDELAENIAADKDFFATAGDFIQAKEGKLYFEGLTVDENGITKYVVSLGITDAAQGQNADGQNCLTWSGTAAPIDDMTVDYINENVKFKSYGALYGTTEAAVADATPDGNLNEKVVCNKVFDSGNDIDVYTIFGFRMYNVKANADRYVKFYVTYELDGVEYTVYSEINHGVYLVD